MSKEWKTINVTPYTKRRLKLLKSLKNYDSLEDLINAEVDLSQVDDVFEDQLREEFPEHFED